MSEVFDPDTSGQPWSKNPQLTPRFCERSRAAWLLGSTFLADGRAPFCLRRRRRRRRRRKRGGEGVIGGEEGEEEVERRGGGGGGGGGGDRRVRSGGGRGV
ncbi:hypothetical protein PoB_007590200 [Plakobranchus ocellatus]|uniref:Uncharacterized protein n=1 Tax=Plakobranchus ocellatus TaxID=259542 RepID=A0AAV4DYG7_9GAST|nr:hypothetical protein PoB_007590200 [Plakobranchus ocellatus]